jgi:hypothetical protein
MENTNQGFLQEQRKTLGKIISTYDYYLSSRMRR